MSDAGSGRGRRVTLSDVARQAEVSPALVSIVMRNVPGASETTRARVLAVANELGYRPDVRARSLAGQRSRMIGVMFGVGLGSFHFDLLEGLYDAAEERGVSLILTPVTRHRDESRAAESLRDFGFDGLIMLGPPTAHPVLAGRIPIVVVGWHVDDPRVDVVRTDDDAGMELAVDHLTGLGHRRIAHIDGGNTLISLARRTGYLRAMQRHGLADQARVITGGQSQREGHAATRVLLESGELPTAVITFNDDVAVAATGLLMQQGIVVPAQISVVGWDDSELAATSTVGLTSLVQRPAELGGLALQRLAERIEQVRITEREIVVQPELQVRQTTAPPS
jgi:DNA-binding LacI/PurR family transcriptional regulator